MRSRSLRLRVRLIERLARRDVAVVLNMEFRGTVDANARNRAGDTTVLRCRFRGFDEPGAYVRINDIMLTESKYREEITDGSDA